MGTLYCVAPLNEECASWLDSERIPHPPLSPQYRNPTPAEITKVLSAIPEYQFEITCNRDQRTWYAVVACAQNPSQGPWTEVALRDYCDDDLPHHFYFTKGWLEIILLITERLSHICGPLAIADDACALPYLVLPGMALDSMIKEYEAVRPRR